MMTKRFFMFLSTVACLALMSCSDGGYKVEGDSVVYEYWTFSFGPQQYVLYDADASSFEAVKDWLGKDNEHVWYKQEWIEGADPASIKADKEPFCHDANDYYHQSTAMQVSDMKSFKFISGTPHLLGKDKNYGYTANGRFEIADYKSFGKLGYRHAKDNKYVYYLGKVVEGADPSTFKEDDIEASLGRDKHGIYQSTHRVETSSPDTYRHIAYGYGRDDNHIYYEGRVCPDIDASTFEMMEAIWARDKDHIIALGKPLEGADTTSFTTVWYFAYDNDQAWYDGVELEDVDMATFACTSSWANDSLHIYYQGHLLEGAVLSEVKMDRDYVVTKDVVWYCDKKLEGADPGSFEIMDEPDGRKFATFDARDKSWCYMHGKKVCRRPLDIEHE